MGRPRASRSGAWRARNGSSLLAAGSGVEPGALVPEPGDQRGPGQVRDRADPAQPEPVQSGADVEVRRQQAGRVAGRETWARRRARRRPGNRHARGPRRSSRRSACRRPRPVAPAPRARVAMQLGADALDEHRLGTPQRFQAIDLDLEHPERDVRRVASPRHARAERPERLERGLGHRPVRVGIGLDEGRLRDEPVGAPQWHAAPDAQRSSGRVGVDDRARIPRPAAEHERTGREGLGASSQGQVERQMRDEEMQASHGRGSFDRGPRAGRGWVTGPVPGR